MRSMRPSICVLLLACAGCGTHLVFVNPTEGLGRPYLESGSTGCDARYHGRQPNLDQLLDAGDAHRNALLSPIAASPRFDPSGPVEPARVRFIFEEQQSAVRAKVQSAVAEWKRAQVCYEAALQHDPSSSYALLNLAVISLRMYDLDPDASDREQYYTRAQNYLARASDVNKYDAQTVYYQAELKARKQQWPETEASLKFLLAQGWKRAHVHNLLGHVYQVTNREAQAKVEWLAAAQVDYPLEANAWAIEKTRPPGPTQRGTEQQAAPAQSFDRWDASRRQFVPTTPPALQAPCVWLENGRTQC
jgi:tetratricopeptide (TPR) repeat protein